VAENTSKVLGTANAINAQLQLLLDKHDQEKEERERAEMKRKEQEEWERKERDQMQRRYDGLIDSKFRQQERKSCLRKLVTFVYPSK
jgi:acetyl-CoA carboxylase carboxyltransferase component